MKIFEFTIQDSFNLSIPELQSRAEQAAKDEAEFMFQCSQGTEEWLIEKVEMEGLPVAKDDHISYKFVVHGKVLENINGNH